MYLLNTATDSISALGDIGSFLVALLTFFFYLRTLFLGERIRELVDISDKLQKSNEHQATQIERLTDIVDELKEQTKAFIAQSITMQESLEIEKAKHRLETEPFFVYSRIKEINGQYWVTVANRGVKAFSIHASSWSQSIINIMAREPSADTGGFIQFSLNVHENFDPNNFHFNITASGKMGGSITQRVEIVDGIGKI